MRSVIVIALAVPFASALAFQVPAPDALAEARTELYAARYAKAAELYSALVAKEPANAAAYYGLVRALIDGRHAQEAYPYAEQALQRAPQTADAENAAGLAMFRKGELAKAEIHFRTALKLRPNNAGALEGMASIYSVVAKSKTARDLLLKAYAQSPDDPVLMLARAYSLKGRDHIQALAQAVAVLDPGCEQARDLRTHIAVDQATAGRELRRLTTAYEPAKLKLLRILDGPRRLRGIGLRVQFNQRQTVTLLLDTGASGIAIAPKAAEKAGLQVLGGEGQDAKGIGDEKTSSAFEYLAAEVRMGNVTFADYPIAVFRQAQSSDFDGLIGADVFRRFIVGIDFPGLELTLDPRPGQLGAPEEPMDASDMLPPGFSKVFRFGAHLALPTSINGEPSVIFLLDSGASANLIDAAIARQSSKVYKDDYTIVKGIQGKVSQVTRASNISLVFAGFKQNNPDLIAIDLEKMSDDFGTGFAGILGMPVLGQMKLTIDYDEGRVRMERKQQPLSP